LYFCNVIDILSVMRLVTTHMPGLHLLRLVEYTTGGVPEIMIIDAPVGVRVEDLR